MENTPRSVRGVWLAIIILGAAVSSIATGLTFYALDTPYPGVIGAVGAAFISVVGIGMKIWSFLTGG